MIHEFETLLKKKQMELEMSNAEFARYINKHRTWVVNLWSDKREKHPLSMKTMYTLHNRLDIPLEIMEDYNKTILESRQ